MNQEMIDLSSQLKALALELMDAQTDTETAPDVLADTITRKRATLAIVGRRLAEAETKYLDAENRARAAEAEKLRAKATELTAQADDADIAAWDQMRETWGEDHALAIRGRFPLLQTEESRRLRAEAGNLTAEAETLIKPITPPSRSDTGTITRERLAELSPLQVNSARATILNSVKQ